jgi:hypothetical protein
MKNKGWALLFNILLITVLLILGATLAQMIFSGNSALFNQRDKLRAYYLAEAAIEYAKANLKGNPDFCTPGMKIGVPQGSFEIKREPHSPVLYGTGYANRARSVIKYDLVTDKQEEE